MAFPTNLNQQLPGLHLLAAPAGTAPRIREYVVSATYSATIGEGCILIKQALGANLSTNTVAAGGKILGVAAHNLKGTPGAGATVLVYDDPQQEFAAVADGTVTLTASIENIGKFVTCISNVYNATLGQGKTVVDISTATSVRATTGTWVQITGYLNAAGETRTSTWSQVVVKIPESIHLFASYAKTTTT